MPNVGDVYTATDWIKAKSDGTLELEGNPRTAELTIAGSDLSTFDDGSSQISLSFEECEQQLGLNKTNANIIADALGVMDTDGWIGAKITLGTIPQPRSKTGKGVSVFNVTPAGAPGMTTAAAPPPLAGAAPTGVADPFGPAWAKAFREKLSVAGSSEDVLRNELVNNYGVPQTQCTGPLENWSRSISGETLRAAMEVAVFPPASPPPVADNHDGIPI